MTKLFPCFVFLSSLLLIDGNVYLRQRRSDAIWKDVKAEDKLVAVRDESSSPREKRGIAGFFVMATLTTATLANSGLQLYIALTEGCGIYDSICSDRDTIKAIEANLTTIGKRYDILFEANQWKYLNLKLGMINNKYILTYIDDMVRKVDDIALQVEIITTRLNVDLKVMAQIYAASNDTDLTGVFDKLVGPFEYELARIQELIDTIKHSQIVGLVIHRSVELFLHFVMNYVDNVIKTAKGDNLAPDDSTINRLSSSNSDLSAPKQSFWTKTKAYFKTKGKNIGFAFKAVGADIKAKFTTSLPNNIKKWWTASKKWSTFKTQFKQSFLGPTSTIGKIKHFLKNPIANAKYNIKNFQFRPGLAFVQAIGVVLEGITTAININEWKKVRDQLREAKGKYQVFYQNVQDAMKELENETITLTNHWTETIDGFKELVKNFKNVTTTANENAVYNKVFGLTGAPVDTSDPFFSTNYDSVTESTLKAKQEIVITFFKANGESLSALQDKFKVQQVLVSETKDLVVNQSQTISFIHDALVRVYKNYDSEVMVNYSKTLVPRDVVCATSLIAPGEDVYDFYPLNPFRTAKCAISDAQFSTMVTEAAAARKRAILTAKVKENVPKSKTPSDIHDLAVAVYAASKDQSLKDYGSNLKEKTVVCEIATIYTNLSSYLLYDLTQFRPDCSQVTDAEYEAMKASVKKMQEGKANIDFSMNYCINLGMCSCPAKLATFTTLSVDQVNLLIADWGKTHKPGCTHVETNAVCSWQQCPPP